MKHHSLSSAVILLLILFVYTPAQSQFGDKPYVPAGPYDCIRNKINLGFGLSGNRFFQLAPNTIMPVSADFFVRYYPDRLPMSLMASLNVFIAGKPTDGGTQDQHNRRDNPAGEYTAVANFRVNMPLGTDPREEGKFCIELFAGGQLYLANTTQKPITVIPNAGTHLSYRLTDVFNVFVEGYTFLDLWNNTRTPLREVADNTIYPKKIIKPYTNESGGGMLRIGTFISLSSRSISNPFNF